MNSERWLMIGVVAVLATVGALSWAIHLQPPLVVDASRLDDIPLELHQWSGTSIPIQKGIVDMLNADYNVQRGYIHRSGFVVWFYVGYYGTERGGAPEHTPWLCYPSNGWEITSRDVVKVDMDRRANELVVEKDGARRLVHFWYQSHRDHQMVGGADQIYERIAGRVLDGRADGSLVRLSTPLDMSEDPASARSRLIAFGREVRPLLREHWPEEHVAPES